MSEFDAEFWGDHWAEHVHGSDEENPYLPAELSELKPGTALDAGCGTGVEALWLAQRGWTVTGVDIAPAAIEQASLSASAAGLSDQTSWIAADLTEWSPQEPFDLVLTNYAHSTLPQLDLYRRLAGWVAPGGSILIVGHGRDHPHGDHHDDSAHSREAMSATVADVVALFPEGEWTIVAAYEGERSGADHAGRNSFLSDTVVRARRH